LKSILDPNKLSPKVARRLGGKGAQLLRLMRLGLNVPDWRALSNDVFDRACSLHRIGMSRIFAAADLESAAGLKTASDELQNLVAGSLEGHIGQFVRVVLANFPPETYLAVRSSASLEDGSEFSFAGQLESFLYIRGAAGLREAIQKCLASAFSPRMLKYLKLNRKGVEDISLAVIVQKMIEPRVSGVMFTVDPASDSLVSLVISANYGLGTTIVGGSVGGDLYTVDKASLEVSPKIGNKDRMAVLDRDTGAGVIEVPVPASMKSDPCLTSQETAELARTGMAIEHAFGQPQDIEWAIDSEGLHILQSRPLTGQQQGPLTIWDNSNINESYPGVTSPLTYSFAREAYSVVYRQAVRLVGLPEKTIHANAEVFDNMIGLVNGHIYYNLGSWYRALALLPGFKYNSRFMEQTMGVKSTIDLPQGNPIPSFPARFGEFIRMGFTLGRMAFLAFGVDRRVAGFQAAADSACRAHEGKMTRNLSVIELAAAYEELKRKLLWNWQAPIINDFLTATFFGLLRKLTTRYTLDEAKTLQNDLLCGEGGIVSTEPVKSLIGLAAAVRSDERLLSLFESRADEDLWHVLGESPDHREFAAALRGHVEHFGNRCLYELKLEEPSLKDRPARLLSGIRAFIRRPELDIKSMEERERSVRNQAEAIVRARLLGRRPPMLSPRYRLYCWVLQRARGHIRHRENMRFTRGRVFGAVRDLFNAIGSELVRLGHIDQPGDVFYLEVPEIIGFINGSAPGTILRDAASRRRAEFSQYRQMAPPPDRFEAYGAVWRGDNVLGPNTAEPERQPDLLTGRACCPGVVSGTARVILDPSQAEVEKGDILLARETDPGWVTLFPLYSGILVERGSPLSHSAIIARELGIPAIVGIDGLIGAIKSGQRIEMDGGQGTVKLKPRTLDVVGER